MYLGLFRPCWRGGRSGRLVVHAGQFVVHVAGVCRI